jgi:Outer membrane protein beta-barrel domain
MLNLSDKDLDRLSQEAAQEHDPGDIVGPRSWEKLEIRLDRDLGKINPNPARGIRRLPYYYAPAMLVLLGVSYYFIKVNNKAQKGATSGSPPLTAIQPAPANAVNPSSSTQKPEHPDKSTSTLALPPNTAAYPTTPDYNRPDSLAAGQASHAAAATSNPAAHAAAGQPADRNISSLPADRVVTNRPADHHATSAGADHITASGSTASGSTASGSTASGSTADRTTHRQNHRNRHNLSNYQAMATTDKPTGAGTDNPMGAGTDNPNGDLTVGSTPTSANPTAGTKSQPARDLALSAVRSPLPLKHPIIIDDSALRAFTAKSSPPRLTIKKGGLHINRSLQLGVLMAPDFSSVNSVAGDRPGSSIGLTVDYQFASRWYIGTGLLISRKNYAAAGQDYHAPEDWLRTNNINNLDYVKGSFTMLEIPLNLRYDFSTTGNTLFFVSAGASSYLGTSENCSYYYNHFGSQWMKEFQYPGHHGYLFSAIDLSAGVETGISNSLSLLIAPYLKLPSRNMGFGQVELSSFGINFALKFAPVLSRKR